MIYTIYLSAYMVINNNLYKYKILQIMNNRSEEESQQEINIEDYVNKYCKEYQNDFNHHILNLNKIDDLVKKTNGGL